VGWEPGREGGRLVVGPQEGANRLEQRASLVSGELGEGALEQLDGEDVSVPRQQLTPGRRQPHMATAAIGRVVLALDQAVLFEVGHDVADHRLASVQVAAQLTNCDRASKRKVLEHGTRRGGEPKSLGVSPMEPEVHRRKLPREDLGGFLCVHPVTVQTGLSIVNPDRSPASPPEPFRQLLAPCDLSGSHVGIEHLELRGKSRLPVEFGTAIALGEPSSDDRPQRSQRCSQWQGCGNLGAHKDHVGDADIGQGITARRVRPVDDHGAPVGHHDVQGMKIKVEKCITIRHLRDPRRRRDLVQPVMQVSKETKVPPPRSRTLQHLTEHR
jgi:hypothetical protein